MPFMDEQTDVDMHSLVSKGVEQHPLLRHRPDVPCRHCRDTHASSIKPAYIAGDSDINSQAVLMSFERVVAL